MKNVLFVFLPIKDKKLNYDRLATRSKTMSHFCTFEVVSEIPQPSSDLNGRACLITVGARHYYLVARPFYDKLAFCDWVGLFLEYTGTNLHRSSVAVSTVPMPQASDKFTIQHFTVYGWRPIMLTEEYETYGNIARGFRDPNLARTLLSKYGFALVGPIMPAVYSSKDIEAVFVNKVHYALRHGKDAYADYAGEFMPNNVVWFDDRGILGANGEMLPMGKDFALIDKANPRIWPIFDKLIHWDDAAKVVFRNHGRIYAEFTLVNSMDRKHVIDTMKLRTDARLIEALGAEVNNMSLKALQLAAKGL